MIRLVKKEGGKREVKLFLSNGESIDLTVALAPNDRLINRLINALKTNGAVRQTPKFGIDGSVDNGAPAKIAARAPSGRTRRSTPMARQETVTK